MLVPPCLRFVRPPSRAGAMSEVPSSGAQGIGGVYVAVNTVVLHVHGHNGVGVMA